MKQVYLLVIVFVFISSVNATKNNFPSTQKASLHGKVTDKFSGMPLPGVSIYFPDLKTGTVTDANGKYLIADLPATKVLVSVRLLGYLTLIQTIDLSVTDSADFILEESITELKEVTVPGFSQATEQKKAPSPISVITDVDLRQNISSNLVDAMTKEPGISQVTTGAGISKPVIRGLGYNRVVVVNDGIRQEGQQWGDEHGLEIDEFSVHKVEILKGPASLAFGSDAIAGVINMVSAPTVPLGEIRGELLSSYQTNNGQFAGSAALSGNLKGFIWDARYTQKIAHDYKNKMDGYVYNTGFNEQNFKTILGLNKSWGYSHIHLSSYYLQPEIAEGERDSATGKFIKEVVLNDSVVDDAIVTDDEFKSYSLANPRQKVMQRKVVSNNVFFIKNNRLNVILGWQQNSRKELADVSQPGQYGLYFLLNTLNYDFRFVFPEKQGLQLATGINGMRQQSENKGKEFLVPEYKLFDFGTYVTVRKSWEKVEVSGGARFDSRDVSTEFLFLNGDEEVVAQTDTGAELKFEGVDRTFSNITGSAGVSWSITKELFTKLNVAKGYRSPNIAELGSNGIHEGTNRYIIGNADMKAETSWQLDYAFGYESKHVSAEADFFANRIARYIYMVKLQSVFGGDSIHDISDPRQTFKYTQGDALLIGGEAILDIHPHPLDWLHFKNTFSFVNTSLLNASDSTRYLPFIPAPRFTSEIKGEFKRTGKFMQNLFVRISAEMFSAQNRIYRADGTETTTPGYTLLNFAAGTDVGRGEQKYFTILFSVNNLLDEAYHSHLSRLKYAPQNYANGRRGVYNMGRNYSIKLIVPFTVKKKKTEKPSE